MKNIPRSVKERYDILGVIGEGNRFVFFVHLILKIK